MSGKFVCAAIAALLLILVIALSMQATVTPWLRSLSTPTMMVEEYGTTGS